MSYSVAIVAAILLSCSCAVNGLDATALNNASFSEVLSSAMNFKGNYSDYLSLLKEKCETQHYQLTSYEQQCCLKIAHAKAHMPFSIIRQNTDIMQFTNDIDPSLFKILLSHFSNSVVSHDEAPSVSTRTRTVSSTSVYDLEHCLTDKSACLEELAKSSLHAQEKAELLEEVSTLKHTVERQTASNAALENDVRILREQREAERNEVAKLTAELESVVQQLMREEENTLNIISERENWKAELGIVESSLSKCQLNLVQTKQDLAKEQGSLVKCSADLAHLQTVQTAVADMEEQVLVLRTENTLLQQELEQSQKTVDEKNDQLAKCAEIEPLLIMCEHRLGHCHNSSSETEENWRDKYDQCSTKLNMSVSMLHKTEEEKLVLRSDIDRLTEAGASCHENYTTQQSENERLKLSVYQFKGLVAELTRTIHEQSTTIISHEEQFMECSNSNERIEASLLSFKNDLFQQLESYNRLQIRYHEQANQTLLAQKAKETCQIKLEEVEGDNQRCNTKLEEARVEVNSITKLADQCVADHGDCIQQLEIASLQIQNCSSSVELASWKTLHEQCRAENVKCESSKTDLASQLKQQTDLHDSCQEKLVILRGEEAQCQTANSELRSTLKQLSDTLGDMTARLQELSEKESSCQETLAESKQGWLLCQGTVAELQTANDQCLTELSHQVERVSVLEQTSAELRITYTALTSRHEACQQERHSALTHVSKLNGTVMSCHRVVDELNVDITVLESELDKCLHSRNLTHADLTEWQARHERCVQSIEAAEQRHAALTEQYYSWRTLSEELQERLTACEGRQTTLLAQRQTTLVELEHWRVSAGLLNQTAAECAGRLQLKTAEALQYQTAEQTTARLLQQCTTALHACQNPPLRPCPPTDGNNTYYGVDLTVGRDNVISAEELVGCYMASYDSAVGRPMKHFCHSQEGHLFKIADRKTMEFVGQVVQPHKGKFLVEPTAYFVSSLGLDLRHYGSDEEICYYIEGSTSAPQLKHDRCAGLEFHAMCWTPYMPGYDYVPVSLQEGADRDPDYLDYNHVDETAKDPDYLDYSVV